MSTQVVFFFLVGGKKKSCVIFVTLQPRLEESYMSKGQNESEMLVVVFKQDDGLRQ